MELSPETILDAFRIAPAIVALLIVIFLQYRLIWRLITGSQKDIARQSKMLTLLEVLVDRRSQSRDGGKHNASNHS